MDIIRIKWRAPIITMVLAATAIPVELRPPGSEPVDFGIGLWDVLSNIVGYLPVGVALAEFGPARALAVAAVISTLAESSQFFSVHRVPSAIDLLTNIIGATLGIVISRHWRVFSLTLKIDRWRAVAASALAVALFMGSWSRSGATPNNRGVTAAGGLEAHWKFDEKGGQIAIDSSGHEVNGKFENQPKRVPGIMGGAVRLDGKGDRVNCGRSSALRLMGSMTISAWINASSFPVDDAAIVSSLNEVGYQLDTTVDRGPRTIGFKLSDSRGKLMARYGATPLVVGTWYHVAGVYNAEERTLDVYLNGRRDNGFLLGTVSDYQISSREPVYIGRRSVLSGFEFAGMLDDVRIYSAALTESQIIEAMRGASIDVRARAPGRVTAASRKNPGGVSRWLAVTRGRLVFSAPEDSRLPAFAGVIGVLVAVACIGFWPSSKPLFCLVLSFVGGLLVLATTTSTLPLFNLCLVPLTGLAGGISVAASSTRARNLLRAGNSVSSAPDGQR